MRKERLHPNRRNVMVASLGWVALMVLAQSRGIAAQDANSPNASAVSLPPALQQTFNDGVESLRNGQLDAAEKAFLQTLHEGGKAAFVYHNLGMVYELRGDHNRAIVQFREAVRRQPDYTAPRVLLGASLLALGRIQEAIRELDAALKLQPRDPLAHLYLAKAYQRLTVPIKAVEQYQFLVANSPQEPEYIYQSGKAYLELSAWCYHQIVRIEPRSARRYQSLAENYRKEGKLEVAARSYQKCLTVNPNLPEIHLGLARVYLALGKIAEARKEVELELTIVPESFDALALKNRLEVEAKKVNGESK